MNAPSRCDVLVVGAGPTGLVLGAELARRGVEVRVVDARPERSPYSRAYGIHARTVEFLDAMGLADAALARGVRTTGANVYERRTHLFKARMGHIESRFPFLLSLPQFITEELLEGRLEAVGGRVERGVALERLRATGDGVVATLRDGDREEWVHASYIVGCDGAHSTVRQELGVSFDGESYPEDWMLADLHVDWDLTYDELHGFVTPQGYVSFNPRVGERAFRLVFDVTGTPLAGREATGAEVQGVLSDRGLPGQLLGDLSWSSPFRTHRRIARVFRRGRVLLAGDAAHIHSPIGGQGMNAGMADAWNLGWKLALVLAGANPVLLDTYEAERRPIARRILANTNRANWMLTGRSAPRRLLLRTVGGLLGRAGSIVDQMTTATSGVTIAYGPGLAARDQLPGVRRYPPGARVSGDRWGEALRSGRPVLVLQRGHEAIAEEAAARWPVEVVIDDGEPGDPPMVLVRPDLHVGLRGPATRESLASWFEGVGLAPRSDAGASRQPLGY